MSFLQLEDLTSASDNGLKTLEKNIISNEEVGSVTESKKKPKQVWASIAICWGGWNKISILGWEPTQ